LKTLNVKQRLDFAPREVDVLRTLAANKQKMQYEEFAKAIGLISRTEVGHRLMGTSLMFTGDLEQGRTHLDRALALYDPVKHRSLAARFGQDIVELGPYS